MARGLQSDVSMSAHVDESEPKKILSRQSTLRRDEVELLSSVLGDMPIRQERWRALVEQAGGLAALLEHGHPELSVRERRRLRALAALLAQQARLLAPRPRLLDRTAVEEWARRALGPLQREELWVIAVDAGLRVRGARLLARGGTNRLLLAPRDCLEEVLRLRAKAFILLHNHPSGETSPSAEDCAFTKAVQSAGELLGLPLIDHLVVTETACLSLLGL